MLVNSDASRSCAAGGRPEPAAHAQSVRRGCSDSAVPRGVGTRSALGAHIRGRNSAGRGRSAGTPAPARRSGNRQTRGRCPAPRPAAAQPSGGSRQMRARRSQDNAGTGAPATDAILRTHSRSTHEWGAAAPRCSTRRVAAPAFSTGHRCTALELRSDVPAQLRPDATTAPQGASNLSTKLPRSRQPAAAIFACRRRPHVS